MENYITHATEIDKRWNECWRALEIKLRETLPFFSVQIVVNLHSDKRTSAINNINYRFAELVPKAIVNGSATIITDWYEDVAKVATAQQVFASVCANYGFQFNGIEYVRNTVPVFVVKVGEF